jgi:transcriptional regulator with XRE-family HTH domain
MRLKKLLEDELRRRQSRNPRYSLRAFARDLDVHHSTLSRVMRGRQQVSQRTLVTIAARLRIPDLDILASASAEAEANVLASVKRDGFRAESRWIATVTGLPLDEVNAALHRLLRKRQLQMNASGEWVAS